MTVWVAATRNPHKLRELQRLLDGVELRAAPEGVDPVEDGATFVDNALIKARAVHAATGLPALADDSGIEVDALDGQPGVWSARFAGEGASDEENLCRLLESIEGVEEARRTARYHCVVVLLDGDRVTVGEGKLEGRLVSTPRGAGGFGYDPAFVPEGETRTVGEMTAEEKDAISHRARAVRDLLSRLGVQGPEPTGGAHT